MKNVMQVLMSDEDHLVFIFFVCWGRLPPRWSLSQNRERMVSSA